MSLIQPLIQKRLSEAIQSVMFSVSPYFEDWTSHDPDLPFQTVGNVFSEMKANGMDNWLPEQVKEYWSPSTSTKPDKTLSGIVIELVCQTVSV
jgi:hypothetical protein